jgi:hypothetical protein
VAHSLWVRYHLLTGHVLDFLLVYLKTTKPTLGKEERFFLKMKVDIFGSFAARLRFDLATR